MDDSEFGLPELICQSFCLLLGLFLVSLVVLEQVLDPELEL